MKVPLFRIATDERDEEAVQAVLRRGTHWADGPEIGYLGKRIADFNGVRHCIPCNNGTSALHAALLAAGVGPDDEVVVPSFTFISTANAVLHAGARPVFADIEEESFGLDIDDVQRRVSDRTRAIIVVHYAGLPARDTQVLQRFCEAKGLILIEDTAEAMGATIGNKKAGSIGKLATLSFCQNKIITTGEGGAVLTNDEAIANRLTALISHGRTGEYFSAERAPAYRVLGYNYRLPTMNAALGLAQLDRIDENIQRRRTIAAAVRAVLGPGVQAHKGAGHVYQILTLRFRDEQRRNQAQTALREAGIQTKIYFEPIHHSPFYQKHLQKIGLPVTERVAREVLSVPCFPDMTAEEQAHLTATLTKLQRG